MISEEKIFSKSTNQKQELPMAAMFVNGSGRNDASYQVSVHLAKGFQRRRLKCEKLTDGVCQVIAKAHVAFGKVS